MGKTKKKSLSPQNSHFIEQIIEELKTEQELQALNSISNAIQNSQHLVEIRNSKDIQNTLPPLLCDKNGGVRNAAANALRELSSVDTCEDFLEHLLKFLFSALRGVGGEEKETFIQLIGILYNLCTTSPKALKIISNDAIHQELVKYLNSNDKCSILVANLFCTTTEEKNPKNTELQETLKKLLKTTQNNHMKILSMNILWNISKQKIDMEIITQTLKTNHIDLIKKLSSNVPQENDDLEKILHFENEVESVAELIATQQSAVELLCNVICEDSQHFDSHNFDDIFKQLCAKIDPIPENVLEILRNNRVITMERNFRIAVFLCLQNITKAIPQQYTKKLLNQLNTEDECFMEAITCCLRNSKVDLNNFDMLEIFKKTKITKTKVNIVKIIANNQNLAQSSQFLSSLIPSKIDKASIWLTAEVIDSIFDIFSEDETDGVLKESKIIQKLKNCNFESIAKKEYKNLGEHEPVVDTVLCNLGQFIQYKCARGILG